MIRSTAQVAHCFLLRNDKESIRKPVASRQLPTSGHVGVLGNQRQRAHVSTPRPVPATNPARAWSSGPTRPPPHRPGRPRRRQPTARLHVADRATRPWLARQVSRNSFRSIPSPPSLSPPREASSPRPCDSISILSAPNFKIKTAAAQIHTHGQAGIRTGPPPQQLSNPGADYPADGAHSPAPQQSTGISPSSPRVAPVALARAYCRP